MVWSAVEELRFRVAKRAADQFLALAAHAYLTYHSHDTSFGKSRKACVRFHQRASSEESALLQVSEPAVIAMLINITQRQRREIVWPT
jgi:hypothetical protein